MPKRGRGRPRKRKGRSYAYNTGICRKRQNAAGVRRLSQLLESQHTDDERLLSQPNTSSELGRRLRNISSSVSTSDCSTQSSSPSSSPSSTQTSTQSSSSDSAALQKIDFLKT